MVTPTTGRWRRRRRALIVDLPPTPLAAGLEHEHAATAHPAMSRPAACTAPAEMVSGFFRDQNEAGEFELEASGGVCGPGQPDTYCQFLTPQEEKAVKRNGSDGDFADRTRGDRTTNLELQLFDYDVNDWRAVKSKHQLALTRIAEFIQKRARESNQDIEVTITGGASRTGTKPHNDMLACRRARCVEWWLRKMLWYPALVNRLRFNTAGEGFQKAVCTVNQYGRSECELPVYRTVLVQVHAPGKRPKVPVPIHPGWDKFKVRCCSYESKQIAEAYIDDALDKLIPGLPEPLSDTLKAKLREWLDKALKAILRKRPTLGRLAQALGKLLRYLPVHILRDKAVFQFMERDKADAKELTLCFTGYGFCIIHPREALTDLIDKVIPNLPDAVKKWIVDALKEIPGLGTAVTPIESKTPGPWKEFDLDRKELLRVFAGRAAVNKDALTVGKVHLSFLSPQWRHPDPWQRPKIIRCGDCAANVIPIVVGDGRGHEILAALEGTLANADCVCSEPPGRRGLASAPRGRAMPWRSIRAMSVVRGMPRRKAGV